MSLASVYWREPLWLLMALYPLLLLLANYILRSRQHLEYADAGLLPWVIAQQGNNQQTIWIRHLLHLFSWCCFSIAMAGPRVPDMASQANEYDNMEVMILLDVSHSMSASDLVPDRISRARMELMDFLRAAGSMKIGLTVFAAKPHLVSPLTHDEAVIRHYLAAVKPGMLPTAGTEINDALLFASQQFSKTQDVMRMILLVTDGDMETNRDTRSISNIADKLGQLDISVYTLGVGTTDGQTVSANFANKGTGIQSAVTLLQRDYLKQLAHLTNGQYADISIDEHDWQQLHNDGIKKRQRNHTPDDQDDTGVVWNQLYQIPLLIGLCSFLLTFIHRGNDNQPLTLLVHALLAISLLGATLHQPVKANQSSYSEAYAAYREGNYQLAYKRFTQQSGYQARMGEADALYLMQRYADASNVYIRAFSQATNAVEQSRALFNLGNTHYRLNEYSVAMNLYQDVLRYQPDHQAAVINLAHARKQANRKNTHQRGVHETGTGSIAKRAISGLVISSGGVTLDDTSEAKERPLPDSETWTQASAWNATAELVDSNLKQPASNSSSHYRFRTIEILKVVRQAMDNSEASIWKRLFEEEEGFHAEVPLPYLVPGKSPW